jgi:adenylosuccinate synthase
VRVGDLLDPRRLEERIAWRLDLLRREWPASGELKKIEAGSIVRQQLELAQPWMASIVDASSVVEQALAAEGEVLFEGAQGTLLDVDFGTYPYVTSSTTLFAGIAASLGIDAAPIGRRLGVSKAYQTRVGEGPFPTELDDAVGRSLREKGGEFGTTTGRPRRCGWLDLVALRYAVRLNGITELALTKLDVLEGLPSIKVCSAYRFRDAETDRFPLSGDRLAECEPIYESLPGWQGPSCTGTWDSVPAAARRVVVMIEEATGVPVTLLSYGPSPEETLRRDL